jgi:hypothetical protein
MRLNISRHNLSKVLDRDKIAGLLVSLDNYNTGFPLYTGKFLPGPIKEITG